MTAIQQDDAMALMFDQTSTACVDISTACDAAKLKCGELLAKTLKLQVNVDEGMWLRDMLLPFQGQRYAIMAAIPMTATAQDVSCNNDAPTLKAAAQKRKQLAQKRRDIINEYPKWAQWAGQVAQQCRVDLAARTQAQQQATAQAEAQAQAALAAKQAEELRQKSKRDAELEAARKFEAEKKAKEDAVKAEAERKRQEELAQAEAIRKQKEAQREMLEAQMTAQQRAQEQARRAAEEDEKRRIAAAEEAEKKRLAAEAEAKRKAQAEEEERQRKAQALADAKFVQDREAKKVAAEQKVDDLRAQEDARRAAADKQIAEANKIDRSDERLKGSIAAHAAADYAAFDGSNAGLLLGVNVQLRYGIWMTAPANGMASGMELKVAGTFLGQVVGQGGAALFTADPELRWYFARFGVGATFEWRHLSVTGATGQADSFALGGNISVAIVDTPDGRFVATLRWLPGVFSGVEWTRINGELEIGFKYFSAMIQAGTITRGNSTPGWFAGLGLGGRLRF
jgi:hypothetical protein